MKVDEILGREDAEKAIKDAMVSTCFVLLFRWHQSVGAMPVLPVLLSNFAVAHAFPFYFVPDPQNMTARLGQLVTILMITTNFSRHVSLQAMYVEHYVPKRAR